MLLAFMPTAYSGMAYLDDFGVEGLVAETELDRMRGGFVLEDADLEISLGIERAVSINGELITTTRLDIPSLTPEGASQAIVSIGTLGTIVQNGSGNSVANMEALLNSPIFFVQNSMDNQAIQTMTVINATVSNLDLQQSLAISSSISQAVLNSLY